MCCNSVACLLWLLCTLYTITGFLDLSSAMLHFISMSSFDCAVLLTFLGLPLTSVLVFGLNIVVSQNVVLHCFLGLLQQLLLAAPKLLHLTTPGLLMYHTVRCLP